jgi:hypothetical protein
LPPNSNTIGHYNHGLGMQYLGLAFAGNPDDRSQYFIRFTMRNRYSDTNFYPNNSPAACTSAVIGGAPCNPTSASVSNASGVFANNFITLQQMWYQFTTPGGIYAKVGRFQMDEGPKSNLATNWGMTGFVNGVHLGYRNARLNVAVGYGFQATAAENNLINDIPSSSIVTWGQADYQLSPHLDVGAYLQNYSGNRTTIWDASAVNCLSTNAGGPKTSNVIPLVAGQPFTATGCSSRFGANSAPIVYGAPGAAAGLPVTGAYINTATNQTTLGGTIIANLGKLRIALDGTDRLGNDPTTGRGWLGNLSGFAQADYGPPQSGHYTLTVGGFAAGMNSIGPAFSYAASPAYWSQLSTDWADQYFVYAGVRKWITSTASLGVFYAHSGLLPNTTIPAGSASCPGCAITGDSRNLVFGGLSMRF